ncbi:hypothetical protein G6F63_014151 [Rhizopus arrhizus]|nr:hypothetical protein G6F63_014151 [Rhizopus arrhizus]
MDGSAARHPCGGQRRGPDRSGRRHFRPHSPARADRPVRGRPPRRRPAHRATVGPGRRTGRYPLLPKQARGRRLPAIAARCAPHPAAGVGLWRARGVGPVLPCRGVGTGAPAAGRRAAEAAPHAGG